MKRSTIRRTAICWWEAEDEIYLVSSALLSIAIAQGETPSEAWSTYEEVLDDALENLKKGKLGGYNATGRPSKGGVNIHCQVQPSSKETLNYLVNELGISQGEVIDWGLFLAQHILDSSMQRSETSRDNDSFTYNGLRQASHGGFSKVEEPTVHAPFSMPTEIFRNAFVRQIMTMKDADVLELANSIRGQLEHKIDNKPERQRKNAKGKKSKA